MRDGLENNLEPLARGVTKHLLEERQLDFDQLTARDRKEHGYMADLMIKTAHSLGYEAQIRGNYKEFTELARTRMEGYWMATGYE